MATWETTATSAVYFSGTRLTGSTTITKITDSNDGDTTFVTGESVIITFGSGRTENFIFRGTITRDGVIFPVVENSTGGTHYVVGAGSISLPAKLDTVLQAVTFTVCFFPGTLIATSFGERKVEELVSGDPILIEYICANPVTWIARMGRMFRQRFGVPSAVPVKWIGRQTVSTRFGPAERLMPVRFAAGSLGGGGGNPFNRIAI